MGQLEPQLRAVLRGRVKARIKERGYTAVLVTHDQGEANAMADRIAVMEAGVLQQFGSPADLRERPANLFVGTFFGEPPMNTLPGRATAQGFEALDEAGAVALRIPAPLPPGIEPGRDVVLGLRPHRLHLGTGAFQGEVVSNQWLGDQAHVAIEAAGRMLIGIHPEREHRRMLEQPELIGGGAGALIGEALHRPPGPLVGHEAQPAHHGRRRRQRRRGLHRSARRLGAHRGGAARRALSSPALLRFNACSAR
jgi:ABC-type sugar transport system ATPase subunit